MRTAVLITNNASRHPAWKWAEVTAQQISDLIQVDDSSSSPEAKAARRAKVHLQSDLQDVLETHYSGVQSEEMQALSKTGPDRLLADYAPSDAHHKGAMEAIYQVLTRSEYASLRAHFEQDHVRAFLVDHVGKHMKSQQHIERMAHADANPGTKQAQAFRLRHGLNTSSEG